MTTQPEDPHILGFCSRCVRCEAEGRYPIYVVNSRLHANFQICWPCMRKHRPLDAVMVERHERMNFSGLQSFTVTWPRFVYRN